MSHLPADQHAPPFLQDYATAVELDMAVVVHAATGWQLVAVEALPGGTRRAEYRRDSDDPPAPPAGV